MSREELIEIAKATTEAYNEKTWTAFRELLSARIVYDEVATGREVTGLEPVVKAWRAWADAFPDSRGTFGESMVDGNFVVLPVRWRGTHTGRLSLPTGEILPTNREIDLRACQIFRIEEDTVVELRHYFDMMTLLSQLGLVPAATATVGKGARRR